METALFHPSEQLNVSIIFSKFVKITISYGVNYIGSSSENYGSEYSRSRHSARQ